MLREQIMPELTEFAKQSLVQGLYTQRNALLETQQKAAQAMMELEARLAALQLPLQERIRAYEKRVAELEKEVESQREEVRELAKATLMLVRKKLDDEREREREQPPSRFN
jgi:isocitrate dehydrogenase kinase/phosphatase